MAEVENNTAEAMDVKIELARIEMKGKEASVTFRVSTDSGPGPHFETDFLVLTHNGLVSDSESYRWHQARASRLIRSWTEAR
jgi:hypothetical protein